MISAESPPLEMGLHMSMNWKGYKLGNGGGEFSISLSKFNYNENNKTCNNELLIHDKALRSSPPNSSMGKIFKWTNVVGTPTPYIAGKKTHPTGQSKPWCHWVLPLHSTKHICFCNQAVVNNDEIGVFHQSKLILRRDQLIWRSTKNSIRPPSAQMSQMKNLRPRLA